MTVHTLVWGMESPISPHAGGPCGRRYLFDDQTHEVIEQEVMEHGSAPQVIRQKTLEPEQIPLEVRQLFEALGLRLGSSQQTQ